MCPPRLRGGADLRVLPRYRKSDLRCEVSLAIDFVTQKLVPAETGLGNRLIVNRLPFFSVGGNRIFDGS
jgi:hypothetical protein